MMNSRTCGIDFGTSNSAVAVPSADGRDVSLALVEGAATLLPTAVFYDAEESTPGSPTSVTAFGHDAVRRYVAGHDGRLMRSMKSILGSALLDAETDIGGSRSRRYADVVGDFLSHLKSAAEAHAGGPIRRAVIGRPVFFVDDDPARDAAAADALLRIAARCGFDEVSFLYEPLAAAFDLERSLEGATPQLALIGDFGGGTCDFTLARLGGGARADRSDRSQDILAHHGIHVAGTDFDRRVSLAAIMPLLGLGSRTPQGREVPSGTYFDLATWHLINTVHAPQRRCEIRDLRALYADRALHERLVRVVESRLGHRLAGEAEALKIAVAEAGGDPTSEPVVAADALSPTSSARATAATSATPRASAARLDVLETGLAATLTSTQLADALEPDLARIEGAALECLDRANVAAAEVRLVYFTGGSSRLTALTERVERVIPNARAIQGDSFASVARGLGVQAARMQRNRIAASSV